MLELAENWIDLGSHKGEFIAQLVEQLTFNELVVGSIPTEFILWAVH